MVNEEHSTLDWHAWLRISRPRFWLYLGGSFLLGYVAGLPAPRDLRLLSFWIPFFYFLLPANLLLYGLNDLFDSDTDALSSKKGSYEHRLSIGEQRPLVGVLGGVGALSVALFLALPGAARLTFAVFVVLCVLYSTPPVRFKARAFIDSYSNALYILPGVIGYQLTARQGAGLWPPVPILVAAAGWAAGMHAYSAIPDIEPDCRAGIRTIAVALGESRTLLFVAANWAFGAALILVITWRAGPTLPGLAAVIYPAIPLALWINPRWSAARFYRWFPALNALIGFLAFIYLTS